MWIKLCGIRDAAHARLAAALGADAIGLNFHPASPRFVDVETARTVVAAVPASTLPVGLFVNAPADDVVSTVKRTGVRAVQLHGDESPECLAELSRRLPGTPLLRAFRVDETGCAEIERTLERCRVLGVTLFACLIDARVAGAYGGTGHAAPWDVVAREYRFDEWPPLVLAGGLHPANVADAIRRVRPWGVDVSSGIESAPGTKDPERMEAFLRAVQEVAVEPCG